MGEQKDWADEKAEGIARARSALSTRGGPSLQDDIAAALRAAEERGDAAGYARGRREAVAYLRAGVESAGPDHAACARALTEAELEWGVALDAQRAAAVRAIEAVPVEELARVATEAQHRGDRPVVEAVRQRLLSAVRGPAPVVETREPTAEEVAARAAINADPRTRHGGPAPVVEPTDNSEFERRLAQERLRMADAVRPQLDALDRTTRVTAADLATVVRPAAAPSGKE